MSTKETGMVEAKDKPASQNESGNEHTPDYLKSERFLFLTAIFKMLRKKNWPETTDIYLH